MFDVAMLMFSVNIMKTMSDWGCKPAKFLRRRLGMVFRGSRKSTILIGRYESALKENT